MKSDIEIAQAANLLPIEVIAKRFGISSNNLIPYGRDKAKINLDLIDSKNDKKDGKLILVTAISPTPAGEGKTTTSIGLGDALNLINKKTIMCLREPSLGPCFGMKGGAAGGGYAQVVPMTDINLHFTGDFHAISAANNLLSALIDNHIYWSNELNIDPERITWRRVLDMNDRALRSIATKSKRLQKGITHNTGFDITAASEVMAIFCLATSLSDLEHRLGNIVIGYTKNDNPVTARQLNAHGAMTAILRDAIQPNLVQTMENNLVLMHGGPFANIAHGCNSVIATKTALKLADYVVTEAGFGADLGAEKFFNIKCRKSSLSPNAVVIVATIRALKMHGGVAKQDLEAKNITALREGCKNLERHILNLKKFNIPLTVAINRFSSDSDEEVSTIKDFCNNYDVKAIECTHWADGSQGISEMAEHVVEICENKDVHLCTTYDDDMSLWYKAATIAKEIYRADSITAGKEVLEQFNQLEKQGYAKYPICMAKTQSSFSVDPNLIGAPEGHIVPIREVRLAAGAEFIVVICGAILTMPGMPRIPAANNICVNSDEKIEGLF